MADQREWLRVPEKHQVCSVSGLKGSEILKLRPQNNHQTRRGVCPIVTLKKVKRAPVDRGVWLVDKAELLEFVERGGFQLSPPRRFSRFFKKFPHLHRKDVNDRDYIILTNPYSIGEEETLERELVHLSEKPRLALAYTRKSVTVIQRRLS